MRALLACLALVAACAPAPLADESTTGAEAPSPEAPTVESLFLHVDEERPCLLVARDGAYTAGRPLETAVRPRPPFPEGLRAHLTPPPGGFVLYTLYGRFGAGELSLTAVTRHAPPIGPVFALLLAGDGAYLGKPHEDLEGPFDRRALPGALTSIGIAEDALVAVVPRAHTSADELAEALALLDALGAEPVLALPLPPETRHRAVAPDATSGGTCGAAPALEGEPGEPAPSELREVVARFSAAAAECRKGTASYEAARGGALELRVRVGGDGTVGDVCVERDSIGDVALRDCALRAAREIRFESAGALELRVPLRFKRDERDRARGLCASP